MNEYGIMLLSVCPVPPDWQIDWHKIEHTPLAAYIRRMEQTRQNPRYHGEDDVWTHTRMVCEELTKAERFRQLQEKKRQSLFLAALLHDIGKIPCTRQEDGEWTSPNHTIAGSKMAREILWRDFGLCGTQEWQSLRECICSLIRCHSLPLHIAAQPDPELRLFRIAAQGELIPDFSLSLLRILAEADMKGRSCDMVQESLETVELCFSLAEDAGILYRPGEFASNAVKRAYLSGRRVWRQQQLYDDTWGEVILVSGLPGTGKDTWIREHYASLPVVSLDEIRREWNISPAGPQGAVINEARERAKAFLRRKQPFVCNATNIAPMIRKKQLDLFEQYHASTRIVFLETAWEEELSRNRNREAQVPEAVIDRMLKALEPPERQEGWEVEWHCV